MFESNVELRNASPGRARDRGQDRDDGAYRGAGFYPDGTAGGGGCRSFLTAVGEIQQFHEQRLTGLVMHGALVKCRSSPARPGFFSKASEDMMIDELNRCISEVIAPARRAILILACLTLARGVAAVAWSVPAVGWCVLGLAAWWRLRRHAAVSDSYGVGGSVASVSQREHGGLLSDTGLILGRSWRTGRRCRRQSPACSRLEPAPNRRAVSF